MSLNNEQPQHPERFKISSKTVADCLRFSLDWFITANLQLREYQKRLSPENPDFKAIGELRKEMDDDFAKALRHLVRLETIAKSTESSELCIDVLSNCLDIHEHIPELLTHCESEVSNPADFEPNSSDTFYFRFAEMVIGLVQHLEKLCIEHPERFRLRAREIRYWPMLVFRHKAANNHLFEKSANGQLPLAEALELGADCPINISNHADYSLQTPINAFLWELLDEVRWGRDWVIAIKQNEIRKGSHNQSDIQLLAERASISEWEAQIYFDARGLPSL